MVSLGRRKNGSSMWLVVLKLHGIMNILNGLCHSLTSVVIFFLKQVDGHNNSGGLDSSPLSRSSEAMLDLEFTLGRPNWQKDHPESSRELTLLKC